MKKWIFKVTILISSTLFISSIAIAEVGKSVFDFKRSNFVSNFKCREKEYYKLGGENTGKTAYQFESPHYENCVVELIVGPNNKIISEGLIFTMGDPNGSLMLIGLLAEASNGKIPITEASKFIAGSFEEGGKKTGSYGGCKITVTPVPIMGIAVVNIEKE